MILPVYLPTSISLLNSFILLLLIKVNKNNDESDKNINVIIAR